jgi:hypothetical protein
MTRNCARTFSRSVQSMVTFWRARSSPARARSCAACRRRAPSPRCRWFPARRRTPARRRRASAPSPACLRLAHVLGQPDQLLDDLRRLDRAVLVAADRLLQHLGERARLHHVLAPARASSPLSSLRSSSTARLRCGMPRTSARNSSERIEMSGSGEPCRGEDVDHAVRRHRARDDLPDGVSRSLRAAHRRRASWRARRAPPGRSRRRRGCAAPPRAAPPARRPCDSSRTAPQHRSLPSSCARMCSCAPAAGQPLLRRAGRPLRPVEAVEEPAADLVLLQHHRDRLVLVERRLARCRRSRCTSPAPASAPARGPGSRPPARRACP